MIILDTNILSALMRQMPDQAVVSWLDRQPRTSIWTTSITVLEVRFGLQIMPAGKRRAALVQAFESVLDTIAHRVVPFDVAAAQRTADLMASRQHKGVPGELRNSMIAGMSSLIMPRLRSAILHTLKI